MRIFPLALIAIGVFALLEHYGLIDRSFVHLFWPLLLIGIGVAMLSRGRRWRDRMQGRWERRMHRHFGPGWGNLSKEERERFRAGMRQWNCRPGSGGSSSAPTPASDGAPPTGSQPGAPSEQR
jgi:hypothetical protein